MATFNISFESTGAFSVRFKSDEAFHCGFENVIEKGESDPYEGAYTFTPAESEQIIDIQGKMALENITIQPIPSDYGRITWDGTTLTVS